MEPIGHEGLGRLLKLEDDLQTPHVVFSHLDLEESMAYGTAGLSAGLCVRKILLSGVKPEDGEVFVTGATGGVGIIAVMLLAKLGFEVVAITGKDTETDLLLSLGAKEVINRSEFEGDMKSPLAKPRWAGGVDAVGSDILSNLITATHQRAAIACCGMRDCTGIH